jgi:hypothetical protein
MIVNLKGRLGNQMFQYAFAKTLLLKYDSPVFLDSSNFSIHSNIFDVNSFVSPNREFRLDIFEITLSLADVERVISVQNKLYGNSIISKIKRKVSNYLPLHNYFLYETKHGFQKNKLRKHDYFDGYWQSELYFSQYKEEILNDFKFKDRLLLEQNQFFNMIHTSNSIAIHVRRGDYLEYPMFELLTDEYYESAIQLIKSKVSNPVYFIFSDDINWVKENMFKHMEVVFVENNSEAQDLFLMSNCKHNVIANSTFSWWGAYLNKSVSKIVISPILWYNNQETDLSSTDIIPSSWYRI